MSSIISITLGDRTGKFVDRQVQSGRFSSVNEVVEAALSLLEQQELYNNQVSEALIAGEKSGFVENFDRHQLLNALQQQHFNNK